MSTPKTRMRRTAEERIQDLQREIERLKAQKQAKSSPARKQAKAGLRALEKAIPLAQEEEDRELERALEKAIMAIGSCIQGSGGGGRVRRTAEDIVKLAEEIHEFIAENPESAMGDIARALGDTPAQLRPVINQLLEEGKLKKKGERRGTRYTAKGRRTKRA